MYAYIQQRSSGRKRPAKSPKGALSFGETPRCTCKPFYTAYMKASRQDPRRGAASFAETPNCTWKPVCTGSHVQLGKIPRRGSRVSQKLLSEHGSRFTRLPCSLRSQFSAESIHDIDQRRYTSIWFSISIQSSITQLHYHFLPIAILHNGLAILP